MKNIIPTTPILGYRKYLGDRKLALSQVPNLKKLGYLNVTVLSNGKIYYKIPVIKVDGIWIETLPFLN